mgnify:CR=1 FL=1
MSGHDDPDGVLSELGCFVTVLGITLFLVIFWIAVYALIRWLLR